MTWRDEILVHAAADMFPPMNDYELAELGGDMKANGQISPVTTWVDPHGDLDERGNRPLYLLDGRNRMEAWERLGLDTVNVSDQEYEGDDPVGYVVSANVIRRHLTREQKRDIIVKLLKLAPERSDRQVAKDVGVDHKTVGAVRKKGQATGAIPKSKARVGSDGKTYSAPTEPTPEAGGEIPHVAQDAKTERSDEVITGLIAEGTAITQVLAEFIEEHGDRVYDLMPRRTKIRYALIGDKVEAVEFHLVLE